ncbi:uncharacterized protein N7482_000877 [Penicillium canariense]|uniref:Uncharacterized protein n=1 Tax=Penicillium canariense TaxID=189055 RepID=A0A9W9IFE5_9EURO|nr:uncharacterized protein N7482_000877 [Penicillium canariense]KAJ5175000.1 hypothetical protein N7482_000877 [Penicillium canariense]
MRSLVEPEDLLFSANSLLCNLLNDWNLQYGLGSIENSVYHTAWVSMVLKNDEWAFPECFEFLVNSQREDGSWGNTASAVDQICNGLASLLAIQRHLRGPVNHSEAGRDDLQRRSNRAIQFIRATLSEWNIQSYDETLPIGFELWFPVLLELLEKEGLVFEVPGIDRILKIREAKLSKFSIEDLYGEKPLSILYSLEAFIGIADFSRLGHHKRLGCIHYSPSATAVYLMEAPDWDEEAEAFLRHIVQLSVAHDRGVPETFPTSFFETSWVLSTLLHYGFSRDELEQDVLQQLQDRLVGHFEDQNGLVGAAESVPPDPDDTAKMLTTLHLLGQSFSPDRMIQRWEGPDHFMVFTGERNASPTANANVLLALVHLSSNGEYSQSIRKCIHFLCRCWWETDGLLHDKWVCQANF